MRKIKTKCFPVSIEKENYKNLTKKDIIKLINKEFNKDTYGVYIAADIVDIVALKDKKLILYNNEINYDLLRELRIFDGEKELYIWKCGKSFKYRIRLDIEEQGDIDIIEEYHYIWGTTYDYKDNWTTITEERGTKLHIYGQENIKGPLRYKVINYLDKNDDGTVKFVDSRIAGIYQANNKILVVGGEKQ